MKAQHLIIGGLLATAVTVSVLSENLDSSTLAARKPLQQHMQLQATPSAIEDDADPVKQIEKSNPAIVNKRVEPEKCVFKTSFEGVGLEDGFYYKIPGKVMASIDEGLEWLENAQNKDGGWGAGSHGMQGVLDPHVESDPATTAMVAMALQRNGTTLQNGQY